MKKIISIFLLLFITSFKALIDLSRPTNKGTIMFGNTTTSLKGSDGKKNESRTEARMGQSSSCLFKMIDALT